MEKGGHMSEKEFYLSDEEIIKIQEKTKAESEPFIAWTGRSLMIYKISGQVFDMILKNQISNVPLVTEGLPEDAKLIQISMDYERFQLIFTYEHPSFPIVKDGCAIPSGVVIFRDLRYE